MNWFELALALGLAAAPGRAAEVVRLTSDSLFKRDPVFINEGNDLVYVVLERPEQLRLVRLSLNDRSITPLHKDETRSELEPAFSRDGRYYAFLQSRSAASVAMLIRDTSKNEDAELPPASGFSGMRSPAFSADGKRVLYAFAEGGRQHIYSVNLQAKDRLKLTDSDGNDNWPEFSPDGQTVLFGSTRDGNYELYLMNADGSNVRRITNHPAQDFRPRFAPGGKRIAFTSNRDGNYEIYLVNVDGSGLMRLTQHDERDDFAAWHPDGKRLVTVSERSGRFDIYLMDVPNGSETSVP